MGEYEPNDSRNVTLTQNRAPGEPPRTGPREGETRPEGQQREEAEKARRRQGDDPLQRKTINEARGGEKPIAPEKR